MNAAGTGLRLLGCAAAAAAVHAAAPPPDALRAGLALFVLIGGLWMTQALHLSVTALLVPLLAVLAGLMDVRGALAAFAHPIIFLFLGSFALAAALQQQGLDRLLALALLRAAGGRRAQAVLWLFAVTAALSMWISNTATAAMMLPLALGLIADDGRGAPVGEREQAFVLLGVAYCASVGGIGTLVGSPPNAIAAAQAGISFVEWLRIGLPLVALLLPLTVGVLFVVLRPRLGGTVAVPEDVAPDVPTWTPARRRTLVIFALTAVGWIGAAPLARALGIAADMDSVVALAAIVALVASGTIGWPAIERHTRWGVLVLFGGGLALSQVMSDSGASRFLAVQVVQATEGLPTWLLVLGVVTFVVFLTELVSNTASAALLVPVFMGVSAALGLPAPLLAAAIAVSASCAFMLPVATPPNAIVFATELVPQATMMRCGLALNLVCIVAVAAVAALAYR